MSSDGQEHRNTAIENIRPMNMRQGVAGQGRDVEIYTAPLPSILQAPSLLPSCLIPTSPLIYNGTRA